MEKRKVLFVAHHLTIGGAQKSMISALNAIDHSRNDVTLYVRKNRLDCLSEIDPHVSVIINEGQMHYYRSLRSLWKLLLIKMFHLFGADDRAQRIHEELSASIRARMLKNESERYFKDQKYDIAISYVQGYTADLVADAINADKKYLFYHSSTDEAHELHDRIFSSYDKIIAVGDDIKAMLQRVYPDHSDKVIVLKNYVDDRSVREKAGEFSVTTPEAKTVLCTCGRFAPQKGFDLAVKAAKRLKDACLPFVWYFVGDGPEREKIESSIRGCGLENEIVITGMQANPYPWIAACDIYVQPSYEEAYGLAIKEAQILCKPVVTTATVGGMILVQNGVNGIIANIDEHSLAESIHSLMLSPTQRETISEYLGTIDNKKEHEQYAANWERLLGGENLEV